MCPVDNTDAMRTEVGANLDKAWLDQNLDVASQV